jgi:hypothetical protein
MKAPQRTESLPAAVRDFDTCSIWFLLVLGRPFVAGIRPPSALLPAADKSSPPLVNATTGNGRTEDEPSLAIELNHLRHGI